MSETILLFIVGFILFEFALNKVLSLLNLNTWQQPLPAALQGFYDAKKYSEAEQYAKANFYFVVVSSVFSLAVSLSFLLMGGFAWVNDLALGFSDNVIVQALYFFGFIGLGSMLISLPFDVYHTFVLEEKFGFNKTTVQTFVADKLKGILLGAVIGGGLLALLTFLYGWLGEWFWLSAWAVVAVFTIFFAMFYTSWLLPLFNKLTPLEDGDLRKSIVAYANKVDFPLTNIFVMDGSKRSSKANAFFSGMGSKKNIVLYDTLINESTIEEITAVLAHEVGHYKRKHILQSMALSVAQMGVMFYVFGWLAASPVMGEVLGAKANNFHLSLIAFSLIYAPISMITGLLMNIFSRKNEYEADNYARETYSEKPLITALKKMSINHLSNLQPHPAYVFFNYSHPTLWQRMKHLQGND
jgi:STE24 endopeptidase